MPATGRIPRQQVCQFLRAAERDAVPSRDLVRDDVETLRYQPAKEGGREEAILVAQHEFRWHVWPCLEWPRRVHGSLGRVRTLLAHRLLGQFARHVVVEADV